MCLITCKSSSEPEEVVVPARPINLVPAVRPLSIHSSAPHNRDTSPAPRLTIQPNPRASYHSQTLGPSASRTSQRLVVVEQRTPRHSSGSVHHDEATAIVRVGAVRPQHTRARSSDRRSTGHIYVRSGSLSRGENRISTVSVRSTRERVVIVDGRGTRREYYR